MTRFTDNVVVGSPVDSIDQIEQALGYTGIGAAYLQLLLLDAGLLGRGAIEFGPDRTQQRLVFGPALIEAVRLEKKTRWPRVALTDGAAELNREVVREYYGDPEDSPHSVNYLVDEESDAVFVNHLGLWLSEEDEEALAADHLTRQRGIIGDALSRETGEVFDKWKWLADMHNHVLSQIPGFRQFRIDAGDPRHSFRSFISTL